MKIKNLPIPSEGKTKPKKPITYWVVTQAFNEDDDFDTTVDWYTVKPTADRLAEDTDPGWVVVSIVEVTL